MGGNVFHNTVRFNKGEYRSFRDEVDTIFRRSIKNYAFVKSYHLKNSFGDMDILLSSKLTPDDVFDILNRAARNDCVGEMAIVWNLKDSDKTMTKYVKNGGIWSYALRVDLDHVFQIDVINVPEDSFHFSENYFSYNDMGNFIGRFAHKFGCKFGHKGLYYPLHWIDSDGKDHFLGDILLTKDWDKAIDFLGFSKKQIEEGFDTMEDVYQMVYNHPSFHSDMFDLKEVSHQARVRDRKRKSYNGLLEWIKQQPRREGIPFCKDKSAYLTWIAEEFPNFAVEMKTLIAEHLLKVEMKKKWNGELINKETGLSGKALGEFMKEFRPEDVMLLKKSEEQIKAYIKRSFNDYTDNMVDEK